jgi:hypothetical protein
VSFTAAHSGPKVVAAGTFGIASAVCPAGTTAFNPSEIVENVSTARLVQMESFPIGTGDGRSGWQVTMLNLGNTSATFFVQVYCLRNVGFIP